MRSVIFDLDGTLADTSGDLIAAANACFEAAGRGSPLDPGTDAPTAFRGSRAMLRLGFERLDGAVDEGKVDAEVPNLLAAYEAKINHHTVFYPEAMETVAALDAAGFRLGVCTNKPAALAELLLTRMGVRDAFGAVVGADTTPVRKPRPEPLLETLRRLGGTPARSVLVGDTDTDRETARAADVMSVLVTFGADGARVAEMAPAAVIDRLDALPALLERLLPRD